jgi:hypothetical protein
VQPTPPFWLRLRQGKLEAAGPDLYRVTAPNAREAFVGIRHAENGHWLPIFRLSAEGPNEGVDSLEFATPQEAWDAAFELYRKQVIV